jgi:membrane protein EpsK
MSQVKKNFYFNLLSLIVNIVIAFLYTPYLVNSLGILAYGILPLAIIISHYINILTTSLTGSLTRFYSVRIAQNNIKQASQALSSAMVVVLFIMFLSALFCFFIIFNIDEVFSIPKKFLESSRKLFLFTFLSFFVSLISNFLNIVLYSNNRLDLLKRQEILRGLTRTLSTVFLFEVIAVDIKYVGMSGFIGEVLVFLYSFYFFRKQITKGVYINFSSVSKSILSSILAMTVWVVIHQLGDLAIYKTDIYFVNKFWGLKESGGLGVISDFSSYVMVLIGVVSSLFGPLILIAYSNNRHEEVKDLTIQNTLFVGVISAFVVALLIGFSKEFLRLWVGENFEVYKSWLEIKLFTIPFYAASGVFAFVYRSWNKVKLPALLTVFLGLVSILFSYLFCKASIRQNLTINYLLIVNAVICFLQTYLLGGFIVKRIYEDITWKQLTKIFIKILATIILVVIISKEVTYKFSLFSFSISY